MTNPLAYSPREAADALGMGLTKLYEEVGNGKIEALKAGGRTIITAESLQRYLASLPRADIRTGQPKGDRHTSA